jgi:ubiquinol-cytochrome c reductase cytochrome b subunit
VTSPIPSDQGSGTVAAESVTANPPRRRKRSSRLLVARLARWLDARTGGAKFVHTALAKVFPDHWSFMLGEIVLYCFIVLLLTGTYLTFFFDASTNEVVYEGSYGPLRGVEMTEAYRSALDISFDVRAGLVMRQIHHWSALLFVAAMAVHLMRVFFTGAFRRPREINWIVGVTLLTLAIFNGLAGYSLLDDQLSGTGLRIVYSVTLSLPLIGTWVTSLLFGGEFPGEDIISRLYVIHILILPAIIVGLLVVHLALVVKHKHTQFAGPGRREDNVIGERFFITLAVLCALGGLVQINPIWLYGPFNPAEVSSASQPDWYMGWLDGALRVMPGWEFRAFGFEVPEPFFPGVVLPGITFGLLYAWPFLEARRTKDYAIHNICDRPRDKPMRTALGVATITFYGVLLLAGGADVLSITFGVSVNVVLWMFRILLFVAPVVTAWLAYHICRELKKEPEPLIMPVEPDEPRPSEAAREPEPEPALD